MEKLYKIEELDTMGWINVQEPNCTKLTKEQCKLRLEELLAEGFNPNRIRLQYDQ